MKAGYNLFRRGRFDSFKEMIVNLNEVLGELDLPDVAAEPVEFDGSLAEGIDAVIGGAGKIEGAPKVIGIGMEAITPETIGNLNDDIEVKEKLDIKMVPNNAELEDELRGMSDDMLSRLAKTNTLHLWADNKTPDKEAMVQALLIHLSQVA
jgi:hypothetical protein